MDRARSRGLNHLTLNRDLGDLDSDSDSQKSALSAPVNGLLQLSPGDELRYLLGRNFQRSSSLWIAAGSRLARTYGKGSEADQRHFASLLQRRHNAVERRIQSIARLDLGNLCVFRDLVS